MIRRRITLLLIVTAAFSASSQDRFAYDRTAPIGLRQLASSTADGVRIEELVYRSPHGGDVPATIIAPNVVQRRAPAVIFVHWGLGDPRMVR